jgi:hypothetical protein
MLTMSRGVRVPDVHVPHVVHVRYEEDTGLHDTRSPIKEILNSC